MPGKIEINFKLLKMEKFKELDSFEMKEINGGIVWKYIGIFFVSAIIEIITNPEQHKAAFKEGYNSNAPQEYHFGN